jgi:hypothetical protein
MSHYFRYTPRIFGSAFHRLTGVAVRLIPRKYILRATVGVYDEKIVIVVVHAIIIEADVVGQA